MPSDLCVAAKIGGASTKPESELSLCIRLARSLTYCYNEHIHTYIIYIINNLKVA